MRLYCRFALHILLLCVACTPVLAQAQTINDVVCEITNVFIGGQASSDGDIRPGDWMILSAEAPGPQQLPTDGQPIPGGSAVFWDLERQNECSLIPPNGTPTSGAADQSRALVENAAQDAVGWDSIGTFFTVGSTDIGRCGMGLRDEFGQTLETVNFPNPLELGVWATNICFQEGVAGGQTVTATGIGELLVDRDEEFGDVIIDVPYGDEKALIAAIIWANTFGNDPMVGDISLHFTGASEDFVFTETFAGSGNALPVINSKIRIVDPATYRRSLSAMELFRFAHIAGEGAVDFAATMQIEAFASDSDGGALLLSDDARFGGRANFTGNSAAGNGGAVAVTGTAYARADLVNVSGSHADGWGGAFHRDGSARLDILAGSRMSNNSAGMGGGAIAVRGQSVDLGDQAAVKIRHAVFRMNTTSGAGCDIYQDIQGGSTQLADVTAARSIFASPCSSATIDNQAGKLILSDVTFMDAGGEEAVINSPGITLARSNLFDGGATQEIQQDGSTVKASCSDNAAGLESLGYNISWDATCGLDQPTDMINTDPLLSQPDESGVSTPLAGSPAIDHGPSAVADLLGDGVLRLPCGIRDINGLGAPQDGDGDGEFECDAGAVEVQGQGAIEAGHSGAFFNAARDGEGQYVEILDGGQRAVIYTFSYTPDGSGAAWFIAVADVVGNSLVGTDLLRPFGTSWGDDFTAGDVEFTAAGGMSMVFPGCATGGPAGNVAYSGSQALGFEPVITKAQRLSDIFGCTGDGVTPHPNAGRSGSWFDPARNGEGLIVEWLPDGRVLVVMFTFAPNGEQMWMIGVAQAEDDSVTVEALYPTGFTRWGSGFDAGDVVLESWGTMTLTWTGENSLVFEYNATAPGYGSATRNYVRLTNLESGSP